MKIVPKCLGGHKWFIDAKGQFRPCCAMSSDFDHPNFNTNLYSLNEIFATKEYKEFLKTIESYETARAICRSRCGSNADESIARYGDNKENWDFQTSKRFL